MIDAAAFPSAGTHWNPEKTGLTIRQWYAGQAIKGILANSAYLDTPEDHKVTKAFKIADKMIKLEEEGG